MTIANLLSIEHDLNEVLQGHLGVWLLLSIPSNPSEWSYSFLHENQEDFSDSEPKLVMVSLSS